MYASGCVFFPAVVIVDALVVANAYKRQQQQQQLTISKCICTHSHIYTHTHTHIRITREKMLRSKNKKWNIYLLFYTNTYKMEWWNKNRSKNRICNDYLKINTRIIFHVVCCFLSILLFLQQFYFYSAFLNFSHPVFSAFSLFIKV